MLESYDAVVVGGGPNGLTAAAVLAHHGLAVLVIEAADNLGGGTRTEALTLPGFRHDVCSAVHNMGCLSPVFKALQLQARGLDWIHPPASVAHPLEGERGVTLETLVEHTAVQLGADQSRYAELMHPLLAGGEQFFGDLLSPLGIPTQPLRMARLGMFGVRSAAQLAAREFAADAARALLAGCAAHAILPLDAPLTAAVGLVFLLAGHLRSWPVARGGSVAISQSLQHVCEDAGVHFELGMHVTRWEQLPRARAYLFDLAPSQLASIAGHGLPAEERDALRRYAMGPGVFKLDWALERPIPWRYAESLRAATVHVGGSFEEIAAAEAAVWRGEHPSRPFVLVAQQSLFDPSRAPDGYQTGYAYCHVPAYSCVDMTRAIEQQVERFAPGFSKTIVARHAIGPADFMRRSPNYVGGAITGGVADWRQFLARPTFRVTPYATSNPRIFLCSHSTPPGGGVHGMCGFHAARAVLRRAFDWPLESRARTLGRLSAACALGAPLQ